MTSFAGGPCTKAPRDSPPGFCGDLLGLSGRDEDDRRRLPRGPGTVFRWIDFAGAFDLPRTGIGADHFAFRRAIQHPELSVFIFKIRNNLSHYLAAS